MDERATHQDNRLPVYNIKAVARILGLLPVTLRAWERRYGLPAPSRGEQGYRLYSDYDLRILRWLKAQVESGMNIGRAVEYLNELRISGRDPAEEASQVRAVGEEVASIDALLQQFVSALTRFDETSAGEVLRRAFALYSIDHVLVKIIQPTLIEMGEAWHRGELPVAVEHFATQFCLQHLMSLLGASVPPYHKGTIVAACAPGELHQTGILMLVVMLRWRGWDVKYLGPDLKLDRLEEALGKLRPRMLLFTATLPEAVRELYRLPETLSRFPEPQPLIVLGGQAFSSLRLPDTFPVVYLQSPLLETVQEIEKLMETPNRFEKSVKI
jgi:MerR family transcriptional regulator, light-induced transcriptional regulator